MTVAQLLIPLLVLVMPAVAGLAWWLTRRYTAAVVRFQADTRSDVSLPGDRATADASDSRSAYAILPSLHLRIQPAHEVAACTATLERTAAPRRLRRRVLFVHFVSELSYWCALTLVMVTAVVGSNPLPVLAFVWQPFLPFVLIPAAIAWILQSGVNRTLMSVASALVLVSGIGLLWTDQGWQSELGFSLGYASIALVVSAFLRPAVRGAGLPLIASGVAGCLSLSVLFAIALALEESFGDPRMSFAAVAIGVLELLLIVAAAVWCGWWTLMRLSARYTAKRFSDIQIALGTYWALLTAFVVASIFRNPELLMFSSVRPEWIVPGIVALWLLWRSLQSAALQAVVRTAGPSLGAMLFLRVFKPSGRSQAFTDRFFAYWRFAAPVWMIGGPDLAGAYMEPNEFFSYLSGRLRDHFVANPDEAARRVEALDRLRDPDGRFRINEMYCTAATWQSTVLEMMTRASVILLDLREYSDMRRG
jgi:hypothetical protein